MNCDYFIYKYTWEDGHVYIGKSKHGRKRYGNLSSYKLCPLLYKYWLKYGEPKKEILEDNISEFDINEKEKFYIKLNNSFHKNNEKGLNLTLGGDGGNIIGHFSKEKKQEINKKRNKTIQENHEENYLSNIRSEYYKNHPEKKEQISNSVKQRYANDQDYKNQNIKHLAKITVSGEEWHKRMDKYIRKGAQVSSSRKCICIETQEEFISCSEAGEKYNIPYKSIWACCKGDKQIAYGYHWCFLEDLERQKQFEEFIGKPRQQIRKLKKPL